MSWMLAVAMPPELVPTAMSAIWKPCMAGSFWMTSATEVAPERWICAASMICTGSAPSAAMRLMLEPVISTRCSV